MGKLKVGILGYGKMGQVYGDWFKTNPYCEVTAVYNHSMGKREKVSEDIPGALFYNDWEELISNRELDIIGITSATYEKFPQICKAISENKHIICEKPICMDINELNEIKKHIVNTKYNKKFLVASELQLHPVIEAINKLIPGIGKVFHISLDYSMYRDEVKWKHRYEAGGGILRELGQHLIDVVNIWLGEPKRVFGYNMILNPNRQVEDFSTNIIEYMTGAVVCLTTHYYKRSTNTYNGKIYGTNAQIDFCVSSYDTKDAWVKYYDANGMREIPIVIPENIDRIYPGHMDTFKREIDNFVDAVLNAKEIGSRLEDEYRTMQIMCASYESSRTGYPVDLPLNEFSHKKLSECFHIF